MFCLFANKKSNPKELFEALQEVIKNRENLNNNKNSNDVKNLYGELKIPAEERFKLCDDNLDEDLREIMRAIIQKAIEEKYLATRIICLICLGLTMDVGKTCLNREGNEENLGPI
ncbi:hypothetical protein Glove_221g48 [Diversispora epigaea]|uniref:Uncharacterized protein n=1 Tax=Diversispora epigaea TaxID=1348612 RepID=A0A397II63_9GLOM|nr:hypothetical protein Glove_221g48 [Diversispora epigaea]